MPAMVEMTLVAPGDRVEPGSDPPRGGSKTGAGWTALVREKPEIATRIPDSITPALAGREYTLQLTLDLVGPLPQSERVDHLPVTVHFPFSF
jgi:hypothetical protein